MSEGSITLDQLVATARQRFAAAGLADPAIDARILISGLLDLTTTELWARGDTQVSQQDCAIVEAALSRRLAHEPVHRILGHRDFHGLDLMLSKETLEPRPDTEMLVEAAIPFAQAAASRSGTVRILDLGTGTGAICLALLAACPVAHGVGSDISTDALDTAVQNAGRNGLSERFTAVQSHWFSQITGTFDVIVSNPPYIESDVIETLDPEVRVFDPMLALDGGIDGLDAYRAIARGVAAFLAPDGTLGLEIGYDQKVTVTDIFEASGFRLLSAIQDYGGNDRVLMFTGNTLQT